MGKSKAQIEAEKLAKESVKESVKKSEVEKVEPPKAVRPQPKGDKKDYNQHPKFQKFKKGVI